MVLIDGIAEHSSNAFWRVLRAFVLEPSLASLPLVPSTQSSVEVTERLLATRREDLSVGVVVCSEVCWLVVASVLAVDSAEVSAVA